MPDKLKYSIIMFIAGSSYGVMVPLVRTSYGHGFETPDIMFTQYLVAVIFIGLMCVFFSRKRVALKDALKLMGMGFVAAGVSFFYYLSLGLLTPAASLVLLFQFVWMGMIVQAVRTRSFPGINALIALALVIIGAVFATGMLDEGLSSANLDPVGVVFGLLSAVCYTAFLTLSSMTATSVPTVNRTFFTTLGSLLIATVISMPAYLEAPMLILDPTIGLTLGLIGICIPIFLINLSSPKLPTGLTTIMASSELPSGVICAAVFLGEPVTLTIGIGVAIVLIGIVVSELDTVYALIKRGRSIKPKDTP